MRQRRIPGFRDALTVSMILAALVAGAGPAIAQRLDVTPRELEGIEITDRAGEKLPLDLEFVDHTGTTRRLDEFFVEGRPVVLQFVYYECPMLCSLVLNGFLEGARQIDWTPGREYEVLSVSFDPQDTPALGAAKRENYLKELGEAGTGGGWQFLTGEPETVKALADAAGFPYRYMEKDDQFSHPAGMFIVAPDGTISRTLYGIAYPAQQLKYSLMEASQGRLGSPVEKLVLYCFRYDPDSQGYVLAAIQVMKIGGAVTVILLGGFLLVMWFRERHRAPRVA